MTEEEQARRGLLRAFKVGAAFVARARYPDRVRQSAEPDFAAIVKKDADLRARYATLFDDGGPFDLGRHAEALARKASRMRRGPEIAAFLSELQGDAIRRALVERNRPAVAKGARLIARARRGGGVRRASADEIAAFFGHGHEHKPSPARPPSRGRGRPGEPWVKSLCVLGLSKDDAEDLLFLAGLRLPPRP